MEGWIQTKKEEISYNGWAETTNLIKNASSLFPDELMWKTEMILSGKSHWELQYAILKHLQEWYNRVFFLSKSQGGVLSQINFLSMDIKDNWPIALVVWVKVVYVIPQHECLLSLTFLEKMRKWIKIFSSWKCSVYYSPAH